MADHRKELVRILARIDQTTDCRERKIAADGKSLSMKGVVCKNE